LIPLHARAELRAVSEWLERARMHDRTFYLHSVIVAELAASFSAHLSLSETHQSRLTTAAALHDMGKLKIPVSVLRKPGHLNAEEVVIMHSHPIAGYELLRTGGEKDELVLTVARDHHERLDGTGYPRGIFGNDISIGVRIVTLCDVFSAITERRPYAEPLSWTVALDLMFAKQTRLDMELVGRFATMITSTQLPRSRWNLIRSLMRRITK
jgi:putative nucleotidyltransferase with HDIG domain